MNDQTNRNKAPLAMVMVLSALAALTLLALSGASASAQPAGKPAPPKRPFVPGANQVINGFPMTITVEDSTQVNIDYRDLGNQFFGGDAEGAFLWVAQGGVTRVFGPQSVPAGNTVNPYTFVSNVKTGTGTASNPWVVNT